MTLSESMKRLIPEIEDDGYMAMIHGHFKTSNPYTGTLDVELADAWQRGWEKGQVDYSKRQESENG